MKPRNLKKKNLLNAHSFQTSLLLSSKVKHQNLGSATAFVQWTPSTAALNTALRSSIKDVSDGQIFFKVIK